MATANSNLLKCIRCHKMKPAAEFYRHPKKASGRVSYCIPCFKQLAKDRAAAVRADPVRWARRQEQNRRKWDRRRGCPFQEFAAILQAQGGVCAICGKPDKVKGRSLAMDHDHATGKPRGLLCSNCNTGVGLFGDNPALLEQAASYLRAHGTACAS